MRNEYDILNNATIDISVYEEAVLSEKERNNMKKTIKKRVSFKKLGVLAACICLLGAVSQTSLAQEAFGKLVRMISTGRNSFYEYDATGEKAPVPEAFEGDIFDASGNAVAYIEKDGIYYEKNGKEITDWEKFAEKYGDEKIQIELSEKSKDPLVNAETRGWLVLKNSEKINDYLCYEAKLPKYLPEGFEFHGATVFEDSKYYMVAYYINQQTGKYFSLSERFINEETAFEAGFNEKIEDVDINGHKAAMVGGRNVYWEQDGISIGVSGQGAITQEELIKVAISIR